VIFTRKSVGDFARKLTQCGALPRRRYGRQRHGKLLGLIAGRRPFVHRVHEDAGGRQRPITEARCAFKSTKVEETNARIMSHLDRFGGERHPGGIRALPESKQDAKLVNDWSI
jgi:hypothetical protein